MPAERYFVNNHLSDAETVFVEDQEFHHLCNVMRTKPGDRIEIVNGKWQLATGVVQKLGKKSASVSITSVETRFPEGKTPIILAQAIPRFNRLEFILEKATELNVSEIWLFPGEISEKEHFTPNQQNRMSQIAISAMKQCGRLDLPEIKLMPPLKEWKTFYPSSFFGDTRKEAPFLWEISTKPASEEPRIVFIGPEKGFHPSEIDLLEKKIHAKGIKLHSNILRVDTASLAALCYLGATL
ncbi:MAG TPA: RsmE family RNA methyltransferase [Rhabdochlamydiaceae bacterium]|nr:RsmE family RNA methyltransferase [Rhabdochlamydiaceae bacterium]